MDKAELIAEINVNCDRIYAELEALEGPDLLFRFKANLLLFYVALWVLAELESWPDFMLKLHNAPVV